MKLMLGTVQFGIPYGTFNVSGQVPPQEVEAMLDMAERAGVRILDTARAYGQSEAALARVGASTRFDIVSKCPDLSDAANPAEALKAAFEASLSILGCTSLYGYLLHNAADLARPGVWEALCDLRDSGRVSRIGVSSYNIREVAAQCATRPLTLVQLPANVLDPWYNQVALPDTVEVHVRSVFLQGFLLSKPYALPKHLAQFSGVLEQFHSEAAIQGLTPIQAALLPLMKCEGVHRIIFGANNIQQLSEILQAEAKLKDRMEATFGPYDGATDELLDPRRWRKLDA